ncbi:MULTISPECIES: GntR family transcriptional regulator [Virgibacillus]|uniref:GntR family transcriptional regulator n=1 Tax=Virgibacillus pantothenticus TaxID=1473 RepID=A0A0L0QSR9_VIRPA|nr:MULTISPECIES: GntR family transcriptional regulator [Virgibacillus]API91788.1 GntR family transcriptional regulator [Virgibacillus sp. 6R]KNE21572.1 GntR family transcriptional regulator [Virgibacillus pantothenticus]MBS7427914.1 GntR family transcriptional regulator [Virgibacillus sp. 19R1-5]MBU8566588.1 GntR family transcriptional regulator [Virgibacillus pantothenticus]MBU8599080.1 GntR family transcriptional regulator [Virgibacillus pantothenticus]
MEKNRSLHAFIKEELLNQIKAKKYKPGDKIPTELELCKDFNVSRTTVRTALNQLTLEGYLERHQGRGTFVADQKLKQTLTQTVKRYSDQVAVQGKEAEIFVLSITVIPANEFLSQQLEVSSKDPIQRIERIRKANNEPTQYEIAFIPWDVAPGITKEQAASSLYASLKTDFDVHIAKTMEHIEITLADEICSKHLDCELNAPCFHIETIAENENQEKVEYSRAYFRGDKTNFVIERNYPKENTST